MKFYRLFCLFTALMIGSASLGAQNQPQSQEQQEKQMMEFIDKEVKRLSELLDLEYWQEFYVDSTLTHDFRAMSDEMTSMQKSKVENSDLYADVRDKWMEKIDATYKRIFNEAQWKKYMKAGGERARKASEKRKK